MKAYKWFVHTPGSIYAETLSFLQPVTEQEARQDYKEHYGLTRLPNGTAVWPHCPLPKNTVSIWHD